VNPDIRGILQSEGLTDLRNLLSQEHVNADPEIDKRADAVLTLLRRAADSTGDLSEPLPQAYFRRSLDIITSPDRFLGLTIVAPQLASSGPQKQDAVRLWHGDRELFDVVGSFYDWRRTLGPAVALERAFRTEPGRSYLGVNRHQGIEWYNRERYGDFIFRMFAFGLIDLYAGSIPGDLDTGEEHLFEVIGRWVEARHASHYQVEKLLAYLSESPSPTAASRSASEVS
jgi:hypothetical protein